MKLPGFIQTNFMPMEFVKSLGGSFFVLCLDGDMACQSNDQAEAEETSHGETSRDDRVS